MNRRRSDPTIFSSPDQPSHSRRSFIATCAALIGSSSVACNAAEQTLDIHVHLFGVGEGGTGCRMSERITKTFLFQGLVGLLKLRKKGKPLDGEYERALVEHVEGSGLTRCAILGQDAVYDARGKRDLDQTHFYTPNDYVFTVVARHKDRMIACPSINPNRADALDELNRCRETGAKLFKIHPPTQGVDVGDRKHTKFFERCAELGMVILVHTGHEHSAPVIDKRLAGPTRLELPLELGCTVVACHAGTGWEADTPDMLPEFLLMLKRYPRNLYGDTSVLGTSGRVRDFGRLLDAPGAAERLVHGSDFPFLVSPKAFVNRVDQATIDRLTKEPSWIKKDFGLKEALGVGSASAQRGYRLACGK
jgi:uncharacterized protein